MNPSRASRREFLSSTAIAGFLLVHGGRMSYCRAEDAPPDVNADNPFLKGNFAPVHEEVTAEKLPIIGQLPAELSGMYVRNGPNPQFTPKGRYHWFDGDGMLHGVLLRDGAASYRNRYVQTAGWRDERAAGKALWTGLAEPPDLGKFLEGKPPFKNAANTALAWHDGKLLCLFEGGEPHVASLPELETVGAYHYGGKLRHPFTAHPKIDATTGEMFFFGYSALSPIVQYSIADAQGDLVRTVPVKLRRPTMMHDFAITQRHAIFMDLPVVFDLARAATKEPVFGYRPELGSRFGVLPRDGSGQIRWFESPACFVFHTLNAWEDGDEVVLVACRMSEFPEAVAVGRGKATPNSANPLDIPTQLYQWRFNLATGELRESPLDDLRADFPRVNDELLGHKTRFGYAMALEMGALIKYDLGEDSRQRHDFGPGRFGGEGVFVARPGAKSEDDGWLLTYVFDAGSGKSELVVVDARDISAPPVARVMIPARIPFGFHGLWVSDTMMRGQHAG
jgi:carotenoid cleavage dioxygenase